MESESPQERKRIEVDPEREPISITGRVLNELCAHAREAQPEECCGLVAGDGALRLAHVYRCRNEMTSRHQGDPAAHPRDGRHAYWMNELDYSRAADEASERGESINAVYHSHVGAGVYFSDMDQAYADNSLFPFPHAAQIVLAVWDGKVAGAGVFERDVESGEFFGAPLEVVDE